MLDRSISTRQQALYQSHGFDIERWADLVAEEKTLRKEISKIAEDYDDRKWRQKEDEREEQDAQEVQEIKSAARQPEDASA